MLFHDPRGERSGPTHPYTGRADVGAGQQVALFANGFPGSVEFLGHIGAAVERLVPGLTVKLWNKGNASPRTSLRSPTPARRSSPPTGIEAAAHPARCVTG